ncbi:MAG: hypothetical protein HC785_15270 [Calothrix sp. CSU_2_0]|nr:hypothetical protein [Calothrix sp. CSU_2_0]
MLYKSLRCKIHDELFLRSLIYTVTFLVYAVVTKKNCRDIAMLHLYIMHDLWTDSG